MLNVKNTKYIVQLNEKTSYSSQEIVKHGETTMQC